MPRLLPLAIDKQLQKAKNDLEWAVRMFHESTTPEAVDIDRLVEDIKASLLAAKQARGNSAGDD